MRNYESIGCFVLILFFFTEEKVPEFIFGKIYQVMSGFGVKYRSICQVMQLYFCGMRAIQTRIREWLA